MTNSTMSSSIVTSSVISTTVSCKQVPIRSSLTGSPKSKFRFNAADEVLKARQRVFGYRGVMAQESRAQRCQSLVSQALTVLKTDEDEDDSSVTADSDFSTTSTSAAPRMSSMPSQEDLGYGSDEPECAAPQKSVQFEMPTSFSVSDASKSALNRRRYARRHSVTEFSLKAAVLAKVQLARQQQNHYRF